MFGFVTASQGELSKAEKERYGAVYCGICRAIHDRGGQLCRMALSYDMAFLALLLMSLYEPEETAGKDTCLAHPLRRSLWTDNEYIRYAADLNIALAYYKALDDRADDGSLTAGALAKLFGKNLRAIEQAYPRQCSAIAGCIRELTVLEQAGSDDADACASCFGRLMGELLVYKQDLWADDLYGMGIALGRFIYLADAAVDYVRDEKKKKYNPFLAMGTGVDFKRWEQYLLLAMGRCTEHFERLPLVQDKPLLDNILYSGVWIRFRAAQKRSERKREVTDD